ncbi:hypothetical protein L207DRAFT_570988 [Hyaloscypha variabilis F]|uniref:Fungal N-terminal domain-containing protein n=1 Tax=Hyaloscypha variabilis (strain UAMH 11265 / GT02V1 / F) TaxID=1149755 RepID=A0A2J6R7A7_HYAVF|nr:hypothetical protein L207DRAFT_570988 [Hyaloscypha variabilis F]
MEVVGLVSSLVGIAAFTGQALDGIIKLRSFFKDLTGAEQTTSDLVDELESFITTLTDIKQLVATSKNVSDARANPEAMTSLGISSLTTSLASCVEDVTAWVEVIKNADPSTATGIRAFLRKMKVAADKRGFQDIARKILGHRQRIGVGLSTLGRALDHAGIARLDELSTKLDGLTEGQLKLNDSINNKLAAAAEKRPLPLDETFAEILGSELQPLEASIEDGFDRMSLNHSESQQSIQSLSHSISSLASQMSQLLNMANNLEPTAPSPKAKVPPPPPTAKFAELGLEWCCDALSGIDDGFDETEDGICMCIYCYYSSPQSDPDCSYEIGRHLAETHSFGKCNLTISYQSWEELVEHLYCFHALQKQKRGSFRTRFCRKKRFLPLFRDMRNNGDHPSNIIERSTEGLIMEAGLHMALDEAYPDEITRHRQYTLLRDDLRTKETILNLRYKIACLLEELMVSGNADYLEVPSDFYNCLFAVDMDTTFLICAFNQISRINAWLLQMFQESFPLRLLLSCGKVTSEMAPATSLRWYTPMIAVWKMDEAATGAEQTHEPSDGAVDSRDYLNSCVSSEKLELTN